jgi:guanosine-3',5'-bis(diphosphate) 3'-pyrophosphohydrolase
MHLDESTIAVALLHDTIEDTTATRAEIDELFGEDIGRLVEGLTKIKKLDLVTKKAKQAENLRKLLLAISDDVRVLLVKLADRLHNMRTLDHMSPEKRARISEETMDIYAPLAGRMGMQDMREELEDLSFRHINPEAYETVTKRLEELSERNEGLVKKIETELRDLLVANGLTRRMSRAAEEALFGLSQDAVEVAFLRAALRRLRLPRHRRRHSRRTATARSASSTRAGASCRAASRTTSRRRSRTTTARSTPPSSARRPSASNCRSAPSACTRSPNTASPRIRSTRTARRMSMANASRANPMPIPGCATIEALAEGDSPEEFLEHTKLELFQDQVFCFTPKGKLIALPRGATPIDFAYAVHTNIGDTTRRRQDQRPHHAAGDAAANGDEVEIIRSGVQVPPAAWEEIVVTGKARAAIRRATRMAIRKQYAGLGHRILERTFERAGKIFRARR